MEKDFSFERSAKEYVKLYITMLDGFHETLPAVVHDCRLPECRRPFGAVTSGSEVTLSFFVRSGRVSSAALILNGRERSEYRMRKSGDSYTVTINVPDEPQALRYVFKIGTKYGPRYLCPDWTGLQGSICREEREGFRLTVYRSDFETPEWFKSAIMYQIFPDRFGFSGKTKAKEGALYHKKLGRHIELHKSINEFVKDKPGKGEKEYLPNDFYGGTLSGIKKKLPYLKKLGITCLYLNPIVESCSNHRYDTANYMKVDPVLGTNEDFEKLCAEAEKYGIKIILDGVYSHTGADSIYFNKYSHYKSEGAFNSQESEYYPWYTFNEYPDKYQCWWGFKELPEVDERNKSWQDYIITGKDSVIKTWLSRGAAGWRLDVADELPDDVLELIRNTVKEQKPDAPLIGEVWEDCVTKCGPEGPRNYALGYSLDSVMNYPLRFALIEFIMGRKNAYSMAEFLTSQQMNYPRPLYYSLMNLVSSHDVDRIRNALSVNINLHDLSREDALKVKFSKTALNKALKLEKLAAAMQFALPGVPCIYYGDEQGMTGVCDPYNRAPFEESDDKNVKDLFEYYCSLTAMRKKSDVLIKGEARFIPVTEDVLIIFRYLEDEAVYAVINKGASDSRYEADLSDIGFGKIKGRTKGFSAEFIDI